MTTNGFSVELSFSDAALLEMFEELLVLRLFLLRLTNSWLDSYFIGLSEVRL